MIKNKFARSWVLGTILAVVSVGSAHASSVNIDEMKLLTATEIKSTIGDSTLSGVFGEENTKYAQRNHNNGIAIVHIKGSEARFIPWFVKEAGFYCEDWAKDGVTCYQIGLIEKSGQYHFINADGVISETNLQKGLHSITLK